MFSEISIKNLRLFADALFRPGPGLNVIHGENGSGKTTLLEALHLTATGTSFRHRESTPIIREGEREVQLVAKITDRSGIRHVIGMRRDRSALKVRVDGRGSVKRSEILQMVPLHYISADPQSLLEGPPQARRSFLDSGLFHVEQGYLEIYQGYARVLAQRNAALRSGQFNLSGWSPQFVHFGERINALRQDHVDRLIPLLKQILSTWLQELDLTFDYRLGWAKGQALGEALERALESDKKQHFTSVGPHRADLIIRARKRRGTQVLSRGQLKMLAVAMFLAQAAMCRQEGKGVRVLLLDDFAAELDKGNRERLANVLNDFYDQVFTTVLDLDDIPARNTDQLFHVEHGQLHRQ